MTTELQQLIDSLQHFDASSLKEVILRAMALLSEEDLTSRKKALGDEAPAGRVAIIGNQTTMMGQWPTELKGSAIAEPEEVFAEKPPKPGTTIIKVNVPK